MPSPFPGMDPYLESPVVWGDFHRSFMCCISRELNATLPSGYYAILRSRGEYLLDDETLVTRPFVEVCDSTAEHAVVAVVEMLSPWTKTVGKDRNRYVDHRNDVLTSRASIVEIDFVRHGQRMNYDDSSSGKSPDYMIAVGRSSHRRQPTRYQMFPVFLREMLPVISIPLREGESEISLDLQHNFRRTYDSGPYARGAVDYSQPTDPPLSDDAQWANERIQAAKRPPTPANETQA